MTDTPGWASPGSPEPPREAAGSSAPPSATVPQDAPPPPAPTAQGWGTPGPYGGAQYGGGQYGGQYPGWGAPPSPKPGVIPLRPLGVGEILDGAMSTVRKHWRTAFGLSLGVAAIERTLTALGQLWEYQAPHDVLPLVATMSAIPVDILLGVLATGLLTILVSKAVVGESVTLGGAWAAVRPQLGRLAGVTALTLLAVGGILLLAAVPLIAVAIAGSPSFETVFLLSLLIVASLPAALWVGIQLSLAAPAVMLEKQGVLAALARSRRLVRGSWWRIFGINLLSQILLFIVAGIITLPFTMIAVALALGGDSVPPTFGGFGGGLPPVLVLVTSIGGVLASTVTIPVLAAINVLLYVDQRIRREALDIELARAAGLPEYGAAPGWAGAAVPGQSGPQGI